MSQEIDDFLADMTRLAKKHKIELSACNCCDGIHLDELKNPEKGEYTVRKWEGEYFEFGWTGGEE